MDSTVNLFSERMRGDIEDLRNRNRESNERIANLCDEALAISDRLTYSHRSFLTDIDGIIDRKQKQIDKIDSSFFGRLNTFFFGKS